MMRGLIFSLFVAISSISLAQNTLIETGRPKPFLYRNAQAIVAPKYKISFVYVPFRSDANQLDSIKKINQETALVSTKKWGTDWQEKLNKSIKDEVNKLHLFAAMLARKKGYDETKNLVYFTQSKCGKKYTAEVYPLIELEQRSKDVLIQKITFRLKNGKTVMKE